MGTGRGKTRRLKTEQNSVDVQPTVSATTETDARRVKIDSSERMAYSSDAPRPRKEGSKKSHQGPRFSVNRKRCRVLQPDDKLVYPHSCLVIVTGPSGAGKSSWAQRLFPQGSVLSLEKMRELISGDAHDEEVTPKAQELLQTVIRKRLEARRTVVITMAALTPEERIEWVALAQEAKRSAHLVVLDATKENCVNAQTEASQPTPEDVIENEVANLAVTRKSLVKGELGQEGFSSAILLTQPVASKVKKITLGRLKTDED